jgi:hypothetical protein
MNQRCMNVLLKLLMQTAETSTVPNLIGCETPVAAAEMRTRSIVRLVLLLESRSNQSCARSRGSLRMEQRQLKLNSL